MEKDNVLTAIVQNVPYPEQVKDIDTSRDGEVRFTWRGTRFAATTNMGLDEVGDGVLIGSDIAILMRNLVFPPIKPFR
jgi:hypothetical protein